MSAVSKNWTRSRTIPLHYLEELNQLKKRLKEKERAKEKEKERKHQTQVRNALDVKSLAMMKNIVGKYTRNSYLRDTRNRMPKGRLKMQKIPKTQSDLMCMCDSN